MFKAKQYITKYILQYPIINIVLIGFFSEENNEQCIKAIALLNHKEQYKII
jgi:hypothetical protein